MVTTAATPYRQIARILRERIRGGEYAPGTKLPTERELCAEFAVSTPVARSAKAELELEGLVFSVQGKGTFVRDNAEVVRLSTSRYQRGQPGDAQIREAEAAGMRLHRPAQHRLITATPTLAKRLHISSGDRITETLYWWYANEELMQLSVQWEPHALTKDTPIENPTEPVDGGLVTVVDRFDTIGIHVDRVLEQIRARMPTPEETEAFALLKGTPVIAIERTQYAGNMPVETADIVLRADRFIIQTEQRL